MGNNLPLHVAVILYQTAAIVGCTLELGCGLSSTLV